MLHPPAVSIGLIYVLGGPRFKALGWLFVALPVRPPPASPFRARLGTCLEAQGKAVVVSRHHVQEA